MKKIIILILMSLVTTSCIPVDKNHVCPEIIKSGSASINTMDEASGFGFVTKVYFEYKVCGCNVHKQEPVYFFAAEEAVFMYFRNRQSPITPEEYRSAEYEIRKNFLMLMPNTISVRAVIERTI